MEWIEWLTNPYVMTLLLTVGLIGLIVEIFHPGFGVPGLIGLVAFALYFYGNIEAGHSSWLSPTLFIIAIILCAIEIFAPGLVIFGVGGVLLLFFSIISAAASISVGVITLGFGLVLTLFVIWVLVRFFNLKIMRNRVVLEQEQKNDEGYRSSEDRKKLLGQTGITVTPLRPSGIALFGDRREDVVSEGVMIAENVEVEVIYVEGSRVVVRPIQEK